MNFPFFIVKKIAFSSKRSFSRLIITIAIFAVAISVAVMILASSIVRGFQNQVSSKVYDFWSHLYVTPYAAGTNYAENPVYKWQDFYEKPENFDYITHIQATAVKGGIIYSNDVFEGILLKGIGDDYRSEFYDKYLDTGTVLNTRTEEPLRDITISSITANRLNLGVGDEVVISFMDKNIRMRKFWITGIYNTGIQEFDPKFAFVDIRIIQELNEWGADTVGGFEIFVDNVKKVEEYNDDLFFKKENNNLKIEPITRKWRNIFDWLRLQNTNEWIILGIMSLVAIFNMITALLILIVERSHMIGVLKSVGATDRTIRNIFLWNGAIIIISGLIIGNSLGLGLCYLQQYGEFIKLPEETYYLDVAPIEVNYLTIAVLNITTLVLCWLVLFLPSRLVSRILPVKVLRFK